MLGNTKRQNGEHIFVGSEDGIVLLHNNKKLIGKNILKLKDKNGFEYAKQIVKVAKTNIAGGYVKYFAPYYR